MSSPAKLGVFIVILGAVFTAAALVGRATDPDPQSASAAGHEGAPAAGHADASGAGHEAPGAGDMDESDDSIASVRGLAISEDGLTLQLDRTTGRAGEPIDMSYRILDQSGDAVRDFDLEHTKRMHLIVVRRDLTGFQHVHPVQRADGTWSTRLTLTEPGTYRVFADFATSGEPHTLAGDVQVEGTVRSRPLPAPARSVEADGLQVTLDRGPRGAGAESELAFTVTRRGRPVAVQPYLGAQGHLIVLREGDLAFLHVHPDERTLSFSATFPSGGRYRLFLQFRTGGRVHTAALTQDVLR